MEDTDPKDDAPFLAADPTDAQLEDVFQHESFAKLINVRATHEKNKTAWVRTIRRIFNKTHRSMFQRRFGLDIWFSFVRLPAAEDYRRDTAVPQATIAYLTLPGPTMRQHSWSTSDHGHDDHGNPTRIPTRGENGFGMAVEAFRQLSEEQRTDFQTAMKYLNLKVFKHRSQKQYPALSAGVPDLDSSDDAETSAKPKEAAATSRDSRKHPKKTPVAPVPRLTLLTRNNTHHVGPQF
jgi:hypothetical protein